MKPNKRIMKIGISFLLNFCTIILFLLICSTKAFLKPEKTKREERMINISNYDYKKLSNLQNEEFTLAIMGTNDIHGQAFEKEMRMVDETIKYGGYKLLSSVIKKIRDEFKDRFLWLDAGDQFTGTVENIITTGQLIVEFYNAMKVDTVAIGNHEWDNGEKQLRIWMENERGRYHTDKNKILNKMESLKNEEKKFLEYDINNSNNKFLINKDIDNIKKDSKRKFYANLTNEKLINEQKNFNFRKFTKLNNFEDNLYLAANIFLKENYKRASDDLPNRSSSKLFEFLDGKIKIGVIGLTTLDTYQTTAGFSIDKFKIIPYREIIETLSKELKSKGAQAVLIVSHVGMNCKSPLFTNDELEEYYRLAIRDKNYYSPLNPNNPKNSCYGEMYDLLNRLPPDTIHGVISGHIHESIHHFVQGIPVIQNPMGSIFTNVLYLKFKKDLHGNFILNTDSSVIEGPIPLCSKVYTNNLRCDVYQDLTDSIKTKGFIFHGSKLEPASETLKVFEKFKELDKEIEKMKKNIIFKTQILLKSNSTNESILGNLIADIYRELTKSDISMVAPGNLRYVWQKGFISEYEFKNMFPFGDNFGRYNVSGSNLKKIFKVLQESGKKYYSFSGVNMTILRYNDTFSELKTHSVKLWNGEEIIDDKIYSFSSNEFELLGGDYMKEFKVNGTIAVNTTQIEMIQPIRESIFKYLKNLGEIRIEDVYKYVGRLNISLVLNYDKN